MKSFTQRINEAAACVTADVNPGNSLQTTGVTNHYTPVQNIVTNVRNLFATRLSFVCAIAEDGVSVKLHSSKFVDKDSIYSILYTPLYRGSESSVAQYITSKGLNKIKLVSVGMYYVVYFYADDLKTAGEDFEKNVVKESYECTQQVEMNIAEAEMDSLVTEDEEEMEDENLKKIAELIDSKDKVKAAKQLELIVAQQIDLPREFYFAGIKFKDGDESIALRWTFLKKLPNGKSTEIKRSLIHIFGKGDKAIWVQDFAEDSIVQLPEDIKKLIESVLDILEAGKTSDPAIFSFTGEPRKRDDDNDDDEDDKDDDNKDKDDDKDDDKEDNKDKNSDDEPDNEDDDSRGGNDDNI